MGFFEELRERRLVQIVVSYLAAGWIGLEVVDQLIQNNVLPGLAYRIALVWFLAGIPAALLIGWHHGEKGKQHAPLSEKLILSVLAITVLTFTGMTVFDHVRHVRAVAAAEASALDLNRIAVLYFEDHSSGGELTHVADGLTEGLIDELSRVRRLDVVSRNGVAPFRGEPIDPAEIGRALEAGSLVRGSIDREGDDIRVSISLLEGETGAPFDRVTFRRPADDLLAVRDELVSEVGHLLRDELGEEIDLERARRETDSSAAWVLYQRAEAQRKAGEDALRHHSTDAAMEAFEQADSLLHQTELLDPDWAAPPVTRAELDYRRARVARDRRERVRWIREGLEEVATVLDEEPSHARALGLRGTLRYYEYLQGLAHSEEEAQALRRRARQDLEEAVEIDPTLASAWSALQHLYITGESLPDAVMAGRRAYEEDAFLDAAETILWRLYTGHYDLGNFTQSLWACREGARRFPLNDRFATCRLELMHTPVLEPDPDEAWALVHEIEELAGEHRSEYAAIQSRLFYAGVLAEAGLRDSARVVLERVHSDISPTVDPERELLYLEAAMYSMLGDDDRAIELLKRHKAANPDASYAHHWWWRTVRSHPRFNEIAMEDVAR